MNKLIGLFVMATLVVALPLKADDIVQVQRGIFDKNSHMNGWLQKVADPAPNYTGSCGGYIPNSGGEQCVQNMRPYCWPSNDNEPGPCSCRSRDPVSNAPAC